MKTLIIAEAGVNHNGNLEIAKQLIRCAKSAGANIVKFQTFKTESIVTRSAEKADYQKLTTQENESQFDMLKNLELSMQQHRILIDECNQQGIVFNSTAFDVHSFNMLVNLGIRQIKIPSGELTNLPFLRHIARHGLPVILSTGMATLGEIEAAIDVLEEFGTPRHSIVALHCTTEYPTAMIDVNLRAMVNIKAALGVEVGYSDHTNGIEVPIAAVAMGASVIEKHFTLDRKMPGPDHSASLEPQELELMIKAIRNIEQALGDGIKRPRPNEIKNKLIARKSIVATREIKSGEPFTAENIGAKRPGGGISPMRWDELIGRAAKRNFALDDQIEL